LVLMAVLALAMVVLVLVLMVVLAVVVLEISVETVLLTSWSSRRIRGPSISHRRE
jgi:hypothetical protein